MSEHEDLAARLAASLDDDPAYERYGELVTDSWGAGQWVCWTDPANGQKHYLRIVVEPFRRTD